MEIKISTGQILTILQIIAWIIFVGLCIEAGAIIFNMFFILVLDSASANHLYKEVDLANLYQFDQGHFIAESVLLSIVAVLKAIMFYLIVKLLHDKKLNMSEPFSAYVGRFMFRIGYLTFGIALFSYWGINYAEWLLAQGVTMPNIQSLGFGGPDVWLFMSVTLFVIAHIFKRGIEIQTENDLTI